MVIADTIENTYLWYRMHSNTRSSHPLPNLSLCRAIHLVVSVGWGSGTNGTVDDT
jgi:hypothetical protein